MVLKDIIRKRRLRMEITQVVNFRREVLRRIAEYTWNDCLPETASRWRSGSRWDVISSTPQKPR